MRIYWFINKWLGAEQCAILLWLISFMYFSKSAWAATASALVLSHILRFGKRRCLSSLWMLAKLIRLNPINSSGWIPSLSQVIQKSNSLGNYILDQAAFICQLSIILDYFNKGKTRWCKDVSNVWRVVTISKFHQLLLTAC